jgi:hypothetical protein
MGEGSSVCRASVVCGEARQATIHAFFTVASTLPYIFG